MTLGVTNTKYAFRQHLGLIGFVMDQPPQAVERKFAAHLGPERYAEYQRIVAAALDEGEAGQNRIYDFMQDLHEANLLRCMYPDVTLDTSYHLYEKALPHLTPGKRVIELACWTGGLSSFIAENHPENTVVGVDRARRVLELDRMHYRLPNLSFAHWDYLFDKPGELEPADILLCGLGTNCSNPPGVYASCDPTAIRTAAGYRLEKEEALRYFHHWRQAAKDGALLLAVLRIVTFPRFLAFLDAAQETGWTALPEEVAFVQCPSNKEAHPSLAFIARPSAPIGEDAALSHWMRACTGKTQQAVFTGPIALGIYRNFAARQILGRREYRNDQGFDTSEELGVCGSFGYVFKQDTRPAHQLILITLAQAEVARRSYAQTSAAPPSAAAGGNVIVAM